MDSTPTTQQKKFGKYIIESELGRGGMGVVYKAYDLQLQRHVALKILLNINQKSIRRLQNESVAMANIDHPNITRFYEFGSSPQPHFAMEFIEGTTLKTLIIQKKVKQLFLINTLITICNCLQEIHDKKILHRDLKPENIMIAKDGTPKIMDFGLAKFTNDSASDLSKTGDIVGTVHYMAPEQISGNVGIASDIYAIGATMYEALTFQKLFDGASQANLIFQVLQVDPIAPREINPKISIALEEVCLKCIAKNPEMRYRSFRQLSNRLSEIKELRKSGLTNTPKKTHLRNVRKLREWAILYKKYIIFVLLFCISLCINIYSFFAPNNYLEKNIRITSPTFLQNEEIQTVSLETGNIALNVSLPTGITQIQCLGKTLPWKEENTQFTQEIPLQYGKNFIEVTFLHKSGQYYKLQRKITRPQEQNTSVFRDNNQRVTKTHQGNIKPLKLQWKFSTPDFSPVTFSPLVLKNHIFFGDRNGFFYCVDHHGKQIWRFKSSNAICGYGSIYNNIVYFGNRSGELYGLDIYTGKQLFHHFIGQPLRFSPLVKDNVIYVNTELENFYAIDLQTSTKIWHHKDIYSQEFYSSPSFYKDSILLPGYLYKMYCFDCKNGDILWAAAIDKKCYSSPMVIKDTIYVSAYETFHAINATNGKPLWQCSLKNRVAGTGVYDNKNIIIIDKYGYIYVIDLQQQKIKQTITPREKREVWSSPQIVGNEIFVNSIASFYSVDLKTQKVTKYHDVQNSTDNYYEYSSPVIHNNKIYVGSTDGYLYAYEQAQLVRYKFIVKVVSGTLKGRTYQGSFSYDKAKVSGKNTEKIPAYSTEFTFLGKTSNKIGNLTFKNGELQHLHVGGRQKNRGYGINSGFGRSPNAFRRPSEQFIARGESFFAYLNPRNIIDGAGTVTYILQK